MSEETEEAEPKSLALDSSNRGFQLLKKCGWTEGTGLGANEQGRLEPLLQKGTKYKRGVGAEKLKKKSEQLPEELASNVRHDSDMVGGWNGSGTMGADEHLHIMNSIRVEQETMNRFLHARHHHIMLYNIRHKELLAEHGYGYGYHPYRDGYRYHPHDLNQGGELHHLQVRFRHDEQYQGDISFSGNGGFRSLGQQGQGQQVSTLLYHPNAPHVPASQTAPRFFTPTPVLQSPVSVPQLPRPAPAQGFPLPSPGILLIFLC